MFTWFEHILDPTSPPPRGVPPDGLAAFYWHFVRQSRSLVLALFGIGVLTAVVDSLIPFFLGKVVSLVTSPFPRRALATGPLAIAGDGGGAAGGASGRAVRAQPGHQPGDLAELHQT